MGRDEKRVGAERACRMCPGSMAITIMFGKVGKINNYLISDDGARCSSVVRAFAHGEMGRRIDPSLWIH